MKKRMLSLLLVFVMVLGMLPASAFAMRSTQSQANADYDLRVLTFEDGDYKGGTNFANKKDWSSLIDAPQYGGSMLYPNGSGTTNVDEAYYWYDENNTELFHMLPASWGTYCYWGGGHAISHYVSGDIAANGGYSSQLTIYQPGVSGISHTGGGHNGSDNFAVQYGYKDNSGYTDSMILPELIFGDGEARVIDHMYVTNTTYALNCYVNGNNLTAKIDESDWVKVVATGYNADTVTGTAEIYLCKGPQNIIMDWTKWDLSGLGEVTNVSFNILGSSDNGYGFSQPAYFAYDDVAVRFAKSAEKTHAVTVSGSAAGDFRGAETAVDGAEYSFTVEPAPCTTYIAAATIDDAAVEVAVGEDGVYTIAAADVTGDIAISLDGTVAHTDSNKDKLCDVCQANLNHLPTLKDGVAPVAEEKAQVGMAYLLKDLQGGKIFEDADGDKLSYSQVYWQRSADQGSTWSAKSPFSEALFGGTMLQVTENSVGEYYYRFYMHDGTDVSEEYWELHLTVVEDMPWNFQFYVGKDMNYAKNGNHYPIIKLYPSLGLGENNEAIPDLDNEITFTDSLFGAEPAEGETATDSNTVVGSYNMFYASVPAGSYVYRAFGWNQETEAYDIDLGGMQLKLPTDTNVDGAASGGTAIYLQCNSFYTTSKKTDSTYFTADEYHVALTCPIMGCNATMGKPYASGNYAYYPVMLYAAGNACLYNSYAYPDILGYNFTQNINQTFAANASAGTKSISISALVELTVTAPADADFDLYFQWNNFNTSKIEPTEDWVVSGDTKTAVYGISKGNGNYSWRLSDDVHVTRSGWVSNLSADGTLTVDFDGAPTNTHSHDFSKLGTAVTKRDEADLMVNLDPSGFKALSGTTRVRAYRHWEIINSDTANIMIEPDFHWTVEQGDADVRTVNGGNTTANWADVTAGTTDSILSVWYEAMEVSPGAYGSHGGFFPATNPERVGIMVIPGSGTRVGTASADVDFNMAVDATTTRSMDWDYNYDTWFFNAADTQPTMDFAVNGTGNVQVETAFVTTTSEMDVAVSGWTVQQAEQGRYVVDLNYFNSNGNEMGGTVIIKMTDDTGTSYRLVRAAKFAVTATNVTNPGEPFMPGNQVKLTFDGLYRAVNKISGIFNPTTFYLRYTSNGVEANGKTGQYQRMDSSEIILTIPEDLEFPEGQETVEYSFTNGYIFGSMYSAANPFAFLYTMTDTGVGTNFNAVTVSFYISNLADATIDVSKLVTYDVALHITDGEQEVTNADVVVKDAGGNVIAPAESGLYEGLPYGRYDVAICAEGYVRSLKSFTLTSSDVADENGKLVKTIAIEKAGENPWDGTTVTEPRQDEEGTYLIGTGAELAWFAEKVNGGQKAINAMLTDDIELTGFNWTPIGISTSKTYAGIFDGCGHTIKNLSIVYESTKTVAPYLGLFGYVGGASLTSRAAVKNLTVQGVLVMTSTGNVSNAYSGGIVGYTKYADLSGLTAQVDVTVNRVGGNWSYLGGVTGYATGSTISECANLGQISGYQYVGGVAGYITGGTVVERSLNQGSISGYQYVGGVTNFNAAGVQSVGSNAMESCYNTGDVYASNQYAGGLAGVINAASTNDYSQSSVKNSYSIGQVTASGACGAIAGKAAAPAVCENLYYLENSCGKAFGEDAGSHEAAAKDAEALKNLAAQLGDAFVNDADSDYPLLSWQAKQTSFKVTLTEGEGYTLIGEAAVAAGEDYAFTVEPVVGYTLQKAVVRVNGVAVAGTNGSYLVNQVSEDLVITVEGAEQIICKPVRAYLSISHDDCYAVGKETGTVMAMQEMEVPYFDLANYGLENFYFSSESYAPDDDYVEGGKPESNLNPGTAAFAYGKVTLMHMYIYALEVYYCGVEPEDAGQGYLYKNHLLGTDVLTITGSSGSSYMSKFWGMDENLNYYVNYKYPLASAGWGSTSDQILLREGDIITVGHFSNWGFYQDPGSVFNYLTADKTTVAKGETIAINGYLSGANDAGDYNTEKTPIKTQAEVYCISYPNVNSADWGDWSVMGTLNADGTMQLDTSSLAPGKYLIAVSGQLSEGQTKNEDGSLAVVSTPGGVVIEVTAPKAILGDVNGDGEITYADAQDIAAFLRDTKVLDGTALAVADVNGDGEVTYADAQMISALLRGAITAFPKGN